MTIKTDDDIGDAGYDNDDDDGGWMESLLNELITGKRGRERGRGVISQWKLGTEL